MKDLQLSNNKIENIDIFQEGEGFKDLEELHLCGNEIKSINALPKWKCQKLRILRLSNNQIKDISPLTDELFKNLEKLDLFDNQVEDIDNVFDKTHFNKIIEILDLSYNSLKSIHILIDKKNYEKLNELKIEGNSNLDYSNKEIQQLFQNYDIKYVFNPI